MMKLKKKVGLSVCAFAVISTTVLFTQQHKVSASPQPTPAQKVSLVNLKQLSNTGTVTYSPDGSSYMIQKNVDLYVVTNGKQTKVATGVASAEWNQDGSAIYYSEVPMDDKNTAVNLWSLNLHTNIKKQIGKTDQPFRLFVDKSGKLLASKNKQISSFDPLSNQANNLVENDADEYRVSPDGHWVAFETGNYLSLMSLSTGEKVILSNQINKFHWDDFAWSDDSNQIAFGSSSTKESSLTIYNVLQKKTRTLQSRDLGFFAGINWLKNGNLVYQYIPTHDTEYSLHTSYETFDLASGVATTLFTDGLGLRLSPDGKKITFVRDNPADTQKGSFVAVLNY